MSPATDHNVHTDVVAYAFGALEDPDRRAFEAHLATCESCTAELADLTGLKEMFTALKHHTGSAASDGADEESDGHADDHNDDLGGGGNVVDLLRRRKRAARRQRRGTAVLTAAAAFALLAGGITIGSATSSHKTVVGMPGMTGMPGTRNGPANQLEVVGERHFATNPATGTSGTVALMALGWGTHVALQLSKVKGPLECQLVAVSTSGAKRVVTGWSVPTAGYGTPEHPDPLVVHGGTSLPRDHIARFEVHVIGGANLLTVPV
jgi:Putative zinc-finger